MFVGDRHGSEVDTYLMRPSSSLDLAEDFNLRMSLDSDTSRGDVEYIYQDTELSQTEELLTNRVRLAGSQNRGQ